MMQNPKQQDIAQNCIGRRDEINAKIFPDGCDGCPNHTSLCEGMANDGAFPQESEPNFIKVGDVSLYDEDKKSRCNIPNSPL